MKFLDYQKLNPCIRSAGREHMHEPDQGKRRIYDYEFLYVHQGSIRVNYTDESIEAFEGQILIIPPNRTHRLDHSHSREVYWVHFDFFYHDDQADLARYINSHKDKALGDGSFEEKKARQPISFPGGYGLPSLYTSEDSEKTRQIFVNIVNLFKDKPQGWQIESKINLLVILGETLENLIALPPIDQVSPTHAIIQYMKDNAYRKLTLGELGTTFHYHPDTINRMIRKDRDKTYSQVLKEIRIDKVIQLLESTALSLDEISLHCGFSDRSHMIKTLKTSTGLRPSDYRKDQGPWTP